MGKKRKGVDLRGGKKRLRLRSCFPHKKEFFFEGAEAFETNFPSPFEFRA